MSEPRRHHYVPRAYLEGWYDQQKKLSCYKRVPGKLVCEKVVSKSTGFELDLYALAHTSEQDRQAYEKYVNGAFDSAGALVLRKFRSGTPLDALSGEERLSWAQFLISLPLRNPEAICDIRGEAQKSILQRAQAGLANEFPDREDEETFDSVFDSVVKEDPDIAFLHSNQGLFMIGNIMRNPQFAEQFTTQNWWISDFSKSRFPLLTSDRPYIVFGLAEQRRVSYVPVSPKLAFFASPDVNKQTQFSARILRKGPDKFAGFLNSLIAARAEKYVYDIDCRQRVFVDHRLKRLPPDSASD